MNGSDAVQARGQYPGAGDLDRHRRERHDEVDRPVPAGKPQRGEQPVAEHGGAECGECQGAQEGAAATEDVTEAATKYSLWGQSLECELAKIDPNGALARQFGAWSASQVSALEPPLRGAA